jgi:SAM-dependent methyltransferase
MWQFYWAKNSLQTLLPFQRQLRGLKRRVTGRSHKINEQSVYGGGFAQISFLANAGLDVRGRDILEVGTGWYPVIPLMMRLAGARQVILTDVDALMDLETLNAAVRFLLERKADLAERLHITLAEIEEQLRHPQEGDFDDVLAKMGMTYAVPFDYKQTEVRVDAVISHTVLEHVPPRVIEELSRDWRRVLRPGGLISHGVDHSDHRATVDARLSRIDFLRYSDQLWNLLHIDNTNRLRHSDYIAMFGAAGFEIVFEHVYIDPTSQDALSKIPLAARFQGMDPDDIATTWSNIIARPVPACDDARCHREKTDRHSKSRPARS